MIVYEIKTTTPESKTSIGGRESIWTAYKLTAKNFEEAYSKAKKNLDPKLKEAIHSITHQFHLGR